MPEGEVEGIDPRQIKESPVIGMGTDDGASDEGGDEQETTQQGAQQQSQPDQDTQAGETATQAKEGDEPTPDSQEAAQISPALRQAGHRAGWTDEDIDELGDKALPALKKLKAGHDKVSAELGKIGQAALQQGQSQPAQGQGLNVDYQTNQPSGAGQQQAGQVGAMGQQAQPQQPGNAAQQAQQPQTAPQQGQGQDVSQLNPVDLENVDMEDLRAVLGDETADAFENVFQGYNALLQSQQQVASKVQRYTQQEIAQKRQKALQTANQWFGEMADDYEGFASKYGRGSTKDMNPNTREFKERETLLAQASAIRAGAKQQGKQMSVKEAMQAAYSVLSDESEMDIARPGQQEDQNQDTAINRPTNREQVRPGASDEQAVEAARKFGQERGIWG